MANNINTVARFVDALLGNFGSKEAVIGKPNFSEDFKRDTVHQITVRGYPVREVSERLGVSTYSLYKWMKLYAKAASQASSAEQTAENRRLKRELARMTEERDILKNRSGLEPACAG